MVAELVPVAFVLIVYLAIELVRWQRRPEERRRRRVRQLRVRHTTGAVR